MSITKGLCSTSIPKCLEIDTEPVSADPLFQMTLETPRENRSEAGFWRSIRGTWRQVYGDFQRSGVSIEWHDFETSKSLDWSRSFHEDSLEICLNLAGDANITHRRKNYRLETHFVGVYRPLGNHIFAERHPGVRHQFVTIELARNFLANRLSEIEPKHLHPIAQSFLEYRTNNEPMAETRPMTVAQQTLSTVLKQPPVPEAARPYGSKRRLSRCFHRFFSSEMIRTRCSARGKNAFPENVRKESKQF